MSSSHTIANKVSGFIKAVGLPEGRACAGWIVAATLVFSLFLPAQAAAQSLSVGSASGLPGTAVDLAVNFTAGSTGVSTMQFDLTFPSTLTYVSTTTGSAAVAAGKSASGSAIAGGVRVLIFGLNQNAIGSGPVAIVRLSIQAGAPAGTITVAIGAIGASDPNAVPVNVTGTNGSVTVNAPGDNTPPVISSVAATGVTNSGATITWSTNEASTTQVDYGPTTSYGSSTTLNSALVTSHSQALSGLAAGTLYHYRVRSRDAAGNLATSGDFTFTTTSTPDLTPPTITNVNSSNLSDTGATISWNTNEPADSLVEYGETTSYGRTAGADSRFVTLHSVAIGGLDPGKTYHFRVRSRDASGNAAVSADSTFETAPTSTPAVLATLYFPVPVSGSPSEAEANSGEYTGLAITNLDAGTATLTFTAYDAAGAPLSGAGIVNPAHRLLRQREQLPILDYQLFCPGGCNLNTVAYVKIESSVSEVAAFYMTFDESLSVLDGAVAATSPTRNIVFPEVEEAGFNRISLANPGSDPVSLTFELRGSDGSLLASPVSRTVIGNGALTADVFADLFPSVAPSDAYYLRANAGAPLVPFQIFGKRGQYLKALNGQDGAGGDATLYCPQYVVGGLWRSSMSIVNLDSFADFVTLRFYSEEGNLLGFRELPITAGGKIAVTDQDFFLSPGPQPTQGFVMVSARQARLAGSVVFGDPDQSRFAAALPLVSDVAQLQVFSHIAQDSTYFMGIAIINPSGVDANATIEVYDSFGALVATATTIVPARGRKSRVLAEYFPPGTFDEGRTSGYVRLISNSGLASFALFGTHNLSVLSAIPAQPLRR